MLPRYVVLTRAAVAKRNCEEQANTLWNDRWEDRIKGIMDSAPSGSGIDNGTELLEADEKRIILSASFHHMNEHGYYDGWTEHEIHVKPNLSFGIEIRITGRDRNEIKDYLHEVYHTWLTEEIEEHV